MRTLNRLLLVGLLPTNCVIERITRQRLGAYANKRLLYRWGIAHRFAFILTRKLHRFTTMF